MADLSPLATAILTRSEQGVQLAISRCPNAVLERTVWGTVLHLSSRWATGLRILLKAGARGLLSSSVLGLAIAYKSLAAVQVLLENDYPWHGFDRPDYGTLRARPPHDIVVAIAEAITLRRQRLVILARDMLPTHDLLRLGLLDELLPDAEAIYLVRALRDAGVAVPAALDVPDDFEGVYHSGNLDLNEIPVFHAAGFHDLCRPNSLGLSPVMSAAIFAFE